MLGILEVCFVEKVKLFSYLLIINLRIKFNRRVFVKLVGLFQWGGLMVV